MALIPKTNIATGNTILASDITNIINSLNETGSYTVIATGSFTGSFTGPLNGTASQAVSSSYAFSSSYAVSASYSVSSSYALSGSYVKTASYAATTQFSGIVGLPASLAGGTGNVAGVSSVVPFNGPTQLTASALTVGTFYVLDASLGAIDIQLNEVGAVDGNEYTFFAKDNTNNITFNSSSVTTIVSDSHKLKLNESGSAAVAKYIGSNTWALIGNLKA